MSTATPSAPAAPEQPATTASIIDIGGVKSQVTANVERDLVMMIWGRSGCGKTVLAGTAPGTKLWFQFDTQGTASLGKRDDVITLDFSGYMHTKVDDLKEGGLVERDIVRTLKDRPDITTLVIDSVTSIAQLCMAHAVLSGKASGNNFKATMEQPGLAGYGIRNRLVLSVVRMFMRVASETKRHIIFICHEDSPDKDKEGNIIRISVLLGGTLPEEVPINLSEVWYLEQDDTGRRYIHVRPYAKRVPMRTRMFRTPAKNVVNAIPFTYDANDRTGDGIATWYEAWRKSGFDKIDIPK